jgi:hypothetical protein
MASNPRTSAAIPNSIPLMEGSIQMSAIGLLVMEAMVHSSFGGANLGGRQTRGL